MSNDNSKNKATGERRKPRYSAQIKVLVFTKGLEHFLSEKTANISSGGLFVCTEHEAEVGEKLHIRVMFSDLESYFDVKTRVVWVCPRESSHPRGLGLEFIDLSDQQQEIVDRYLSRYINIKEK